jgi:hypothetical protein
MDLEYQEQLIEYKIHELNLLINDFVNKLKIQVLPAILCFMDGIVRDK